MADQSIDDLMGYKSNASAPVPPPVPKQGAVSTPEKSIDDLMGYKPSSTPPAPEKPQGLLGGLGEAVRSIPGGIADSLQQLVNMSQFTQRHIVPPPAQWLTAPYLDYSKTITAANKLAGQPPQPYMNTVPDINKALGVMNPQGMASQIGSAIGGAAPYALIPAGAAGSLGKAALGGAMAGGAGGAINELGNQVLQNDQVNPGAVAQQAGLGALGGGLLGGGVHGAGQLLEGLARAGQYGKVKAQRALVQGQRAAAKRGAYPALTPERQPG